MQIGPHQRDGFAIRRLHKRARRGYSFNAAQCLQRLVLPSQRPLRIAPEAIHQRMPARRLDEKGPLFSSHVQRDNRGPLRAHLQHARNHEALAEEAKVVQRFCMAQPLRRLRRGLAGSIHAQRAIRHGKHALLAPQQIDFRETVICGIAHIDRGIGGIAQVRHHFRPRQPAQCLRQCRA